MTMEARKRRTSTQTARLRRSRVPLGNIRRNPEGQIEMIEFTPYTRNPLAPRIFVNDVGGIYRLDGGIWCVTFIQKFDGSSGVIEAVEQGSLIWPERNWHAAGELFRWVLPEILREAARGGPQPPRGAH